MPRRTSTSTLTATPRYVLSSESSETLPLSNVLQLRRQWKWAAFSQFFFTFKTLFASNEVTLTDIERDLTRSTNVVLSRIMQRLLYTLTQDRKISPETWQTALRKQYLKRGPKSNSLRLDPPSFVEPSSPPIFYKTHLSSTESFSASPKNSVSPEPGSPENAVDGHGYPSGMQTRENTGRRPVGKMEDNGEYNWLDLHMLEQLDSMYLLSEWQFQNPMRLRSIMRDDDETAKWRFEPIGYDAKSNSYWLIGADRLWIQRSLSNSRSLKRKRTLRPDHKGGVLQFKGQSTKRRRLSLQTIDSSSLSPQPLHEICHRTEMGVGTSHGNRTAKTHPNMELNVHAKDSRELVIKYGKPERRRLQQPLGTRVSARLRADIAQEGWQIVPEEWLEDVDIPKRSPAPRELLDARGKGLKTGLESDRDSISDLTELSSDDQDANHANADYSSPPVTLEFTSPKHCGSPGDDCLRESDEAAIVEWETICVTADEWEHVAERFKNATHHAEKALYSVLTHNIVPVVTSMLRETERRQRLDEALVHRKRSSRIAIKESEKEEARVVAKKQAQGEEKMSRARRLEARLQREGAERERRETARDQRRKETEDQQQVERSADLGDANSDEAFVDCSLFQKIHVNGMHNGSGSGSRTPAGDDWELDCDICHERGVNQDDGTPIVCCGICSKWQHISCHDRADDYAGRPKRKWNIEEFVCQQCRSRSSRHLVLGPQPSHINQMGSRQPLDKVTTAVQLSTQPELLGPRFSNHCSEQQNHAPATNGSPYSKAEIPHFIPQTQRHRARDGITLHEFSHTQRSYGDVRGPHLQTNIPTITQYPDIGPSSQSFLNRVHTRTNITGWDVSHLDIHNYSSFNNVPANRPGHSPDGDPRPPEPHDPHRQPQTFSFRHQERTDIRRFQPPL